MALMKSRCTYPKTYWAPKFGHSLVLNLTFPYCTHLSFSTPLTMLLSLCSLTWQMINDKSIFKGHHHLLYPTYHSFIPLVIQNIYWHLLFSRQYFGWWSFSNEKKQISTFNSLYFSDWDEQYTSGNVNTSWFPLLGAALHSTVINRIALYFYKS